MRIKGEFRDVLKKNEEIIEDRGWKSNTIVADFGNFLAALMKKDFKDEKDTSIGIGVDYIAVGGGRNNNSKEFQPKVNEFFKNINPEKSEWNKPYLDVSNEDNWVWVKKINDSEIAYLSDDNKKTANKVTNKLQIELTFDKNYPDSIKPLKFEEFALLGYYDKGTETDKEAKIFFVNYATHGVITKEKDMTLKRTIHLTFPIN